VAVHQPSFDDLGTSLREVTFSILDLETTGLSPERDAITEIGVVKVRGGITLGEFQSLVHPGRPIPPAITALTGISDALIADRPPIEAALPALLEFLRGTVIVAHNAHFDHGFLRATCARHAYPPPAGPPVCTARLARRALGRGEVRDVRLATLSTHLRARVQPEHRALTDARATVDVFHGLLERVGSVGVRTLEDLRDYARSTSDPAFRKVRLVADAPDAPGVYRFHGPRDEVLYVGRSRSLRTRLRTYFGQDRRRRIADLVRETERVTWRTTPTVLEAEVREVREIHRHRPRYNRRSRHPERAVLVKLTRERFPRLSVVTAVREPEAVHVGPLPSRRAADRFVTAVHDALPLRQCTDRITANRAPAPCVLKDLGRCGAPCDGTQGEDDYSAVVSAYVHAVTTDPTPLLGRLRDRMSVHSERGRFEQAGEDRRRLHDTARLLLEQRRLAALIAVPRLIASRPVQGALEVIVVERGRLISTNLLDAATTDEEMLAESRSATTDGEGVGLDPGDLEEVRLVATALEAPGTRIVHATAGYASPLAGGHALTAAVDEARRVAQVVRRDRDLLGGDKVLARHLPPEAARAAV
jgi:DNA polymerase III subunit epsilon